MDLWAQHGLRHHELHSRMTGCAHAAIAGSHQIVDQEDAQPEGRGKQGGGDLAGALHDAELEDAGPVKQGLPGELGL